jgi:hypothetical protein
MIPVRCTTRTNVLVNTWLPAYYTGSNYNGKRLRSHVSVAHEELEALSTVRPYSEIPGPKPIPLLGNTWRLLPVVGKLIFFFFVYYTYCCCFQIII